MTTEPGTADRSRRDTLRAAAKMGLLLAGAGVAGSLGACGSTGRSARSARLDRLGDPVPGDPVFTPSKPAPIRSDAPSGVASGSLGALPSFVIPRAKWTSGMTKEWLADPMAPIRRITIHHDAISPRPSSRWSDSVRRLKAIRSGHLSHRWADIGYHYAVDPAGRVWQARPIFYQGAHVKDHNPGNIGIVVFGNHQRVHPTEAAVRSVNRLVAHEMARFRVPLDAVVTHRELAPTVCPGRHLQLRMDRIRRPGGELASAVAGMPIGV